MDSCGKKSQAEGTVRAKALRWREFATSSEQQRVERMEERVVRDESGIRTPRALKMVVMNFIQREVQ